MWQKRQTGSDQRKSVDDRATRHACETVQPMCRWDHDIIGRRYPIGQRLESLDRPVISLTDEAKPLSRKTCARRIGKQHMTRGLAGVADKSDRCLSTASRHCAETRNDCGRETHLVKGRERGRNSNINANV